MLIIYKVYVYASVSLVRKSYLIQTVSVLQANVQGQKDNMKVCMLQVLQERNKPMV